MIWNPAFIYFLFAAGMVSCCEFPDVTATLCAECFAEVNNSEGALGHRVQGTLESCRIRFTEWAH